MNCPSSFAWPLLTACLLQLTGIPFNFHPLIWVAWAPWLAWLPQAGSARRAFGYSALIGAVYHLNLLSPFLSIGWWGWGTVSTEGFARFLSHSRLFMLGAIVLISLWAGLVMGGLGLLLRRAMRRPGLALIIVPCMWVVLLEWVGHRTVWGFTWGLVGNHLAGFATLRQLAAVTGVYGLSFLVIMVNALLAAWLRWCLQRPHPNPREPLLAAVAVGVVLLAVAGYGRARLSQDLAHGNTGWHVAALQGARAAYAAEDFTGEGFDTLYSSLIQQATSEPVDFIVLPESVWLKTVQLGEAAASDAEAIAPAEVASFLAHQVRDASTVVALGIDTRQGTATYNSTTYWARQELLGTYHKRRLVPFTEYRPALFGGLAPQNEIHGAAFQFTPGQGPQLVSVRGVPVGSFICQEVLFPDLVRKTVQAGAQLLVTTGNDGVFHSPAVAHEHARLAQLRAVETGRYIIRAMKTGISAVIDPQGRVLAQAPVNAQAVVRGTVYLQTRQTPYTRYGDWFVACAALVLVGWGYAVLRGSQVSCES